MKEEKEDIENELVNIEKEIASLNEQRKMLLFILGNMSEVKA